MTSSSQSSRQLLLLFRYEAQQHSYPTKIPGQTGLRFVSSPEITTKLYTVPTDDEKTDLVPPSGSLEKSSLIYLIMTTDSTKEKKFCSNCKDISGKLSCIGSFFESDDKAIEKRWSFSSLEEESIVCTTGGESNNSDEDEEPCFFCDTTSAKVIAYASFAFVLSANSSFSQRPIPEAYLISVVVSKNFRKQELCTKLLKCSFSDILKKYDSKNEDAFIQRVRLHVRSDLPFLKEMYLKFGFVVRRNCPRYYPVDGIDAVEMLNENFVSKATLFLINNNESGQRRERGE